MAKVFISYSKRDYIGPDGSPLADSFVNKILNTLTDNNIDFWIDREGLDPGVRYAEIIVKNIKACDTFLFLATQNANASPWTLREISTAIEFGKRILPVRIDSSPYADAVALYLISIQYIDWQELGEKDALQRIVSCIREETVSGLPDGPQKLPGFTKGVLYAGLAVLTTAYAALTFLFLWAHALRSSEIIGGLIGYICEFGILTSIWYMVRLLRLRKCNFAFPGAVCAVMLLSGLLMRDSDILLCSILLFGGWLLVFAVCLSGKKKNYFRVMSKKQLLLKPSDPENLLLLYLIVKAFILVLAHYFNITTELHILLF